MPEHARVFEPVVSGANNLQCSVSGCNKCRVLPVYGFLSHLRKWWRGVPRVEAACRFFDQPLATFADGETIKVMRCFACLQTETSLPTVEQWLDAQQQDDNVREILPAQSRHSDEDRAKHSAWLQRNRGGR